jgi:hypothetical protein
MIMGPEIRPLGFWGFAKLPENNRKSKINAIVEPICFFKSFLHGKLFSLDYSS